MSSEDSEHTVCSLSDSDSGSDAVLVHPPACKRSSGARTPSWVYDHVVDLNATHRRCSYCPTTFGRGTSTGTLGAHLRKVHGRSKSSNETAPLARQLDIREAPLPLVAKRKYDSFIATYFVNTLLPHDHVASAGFELLMQRLVPQYKCPSPKTIKRRILAMYMVLKIFLVHQLSALSVALSVTFDGWSNSALRGFYACTAHWTDIATGELSEVILDFFYVPPGPGVGARCGHYLYKVLDAFGAVDKLIAVVTDNGSDAVVATGTLQHLVGLHDERVLPLHHVRCFAHVFQLGIKPIIDAISPATSTLRACISQIRSSKRLRALFRTMAGVYAGAEREPPCLDCPTRWNSTHIMVRQCLVLRSTISAVVQADASLSGFRLDPSDWLKLEAVEKFLRVPASVSTQVGASAHPTISFAKGANMCLIAHCNKYVDHDVLVLKEASQAMLAVLVRYEADLNCTASVIGRFLDVRVARDTASDDYASDLLVVEAALASPRYASIAVAPPAACPHELDEDEADLFGSVAAPAAVHVGEVQRFGLTIQTPKNTGVLTWWFAHRGEFPMLFQLAIDYLSTPATSVPSERANSAAKRVFDGRATLGEEMFKAEICCQSWLKLAKTVGFNPPDDYLVALVEAKSHVDLDDMATTDSVIRYYLESDKA